MIKFILLFLFFVTLNASTITLDYSDAKFEDFEISYIQDKNSSLNINQIKNMKFNVIDHMHAFNGKSGNIWYKIKLNNSTSMEKEVFIHNNLAYYLKTIEVFEFHNKHFTNKNVYNILDNEDIALIGSTFVYPIKIPANDGLTLYIINTPMISNYADFNIYDKKSSVISIMNKDFYFLIIISVMLTLVFYNATLYLFNQRKEFLFYAIYMLIPAIGLTYKYGVIFSQFNLYGESVYYLNLTAIIMPAFLLLFVQQVLHTKNLNKNINLILNILILNIFIDALIGIFIDLTLSLEIFKVLFMMTAVLIIYIIIYLFKTSHPLAKIFSFAYAAYLTGMIITILAMSNVVELNYFTFASGGMGLIVEGLLFSYLMHYNVKLLEKEIREQKEIIVTKNKKEQLGGMINAITHQWKQPLSRITAITALLEFKLSHKQEISIDELSKKVVQINSNTHFLNGTIDDFKDFFNPDAKKENCDISELISKAITLSRDDTLAKEIIINQDLYFPNPISIYKNQLLHIILNILQNAKEAFDENDNNIKIINVYGSIVNKKIQIDILDNAGGIDEDKLPFIFNENFTTKEDQPGNGLGLYNHKNNTPRASKRFYRGKKNRRWNNV